MEGLRSHLKTVTLLISYGILCSPPPTLAVSLFKCK